MRWTPNRYRYLISWGYAPYFGTGVSVVSLSRDWQAMHVRMKLRWYNRNAVGTHFGGSLYAMIDPHCMIMLMQQLGPKFIVWDQSARIRFIRPGRGTVHCHIQMPADLVESIREQAIAGETPRPEFTLCIVDDRGETICEVDKQLYVKYRGDVEDQPPLNSS